MGLWLWEERLESLLARRAQCLDSRLVADVDTATLSEVERLDRRIRSFASALAPDAPETVIEHAQQRLAFEDLGERLIERSGWTVEPELATEAARIRIERLEREILDRAKVMSPDDPPAAIRRATGAATRQWVNGKGWSEGKAAKLRRMSRRMRRLAGRPGPGQGMRISRTLKDLRRLERLDGEARIWARERSALPEHGSVYRLERSIRGQPSPRKILLRSGALRTIYRRPGLARRALEASFARAPERWTLERFRERPGAFGQLRGVAGFAKRRCALARVRLTAAVALEAHEARCELECALETARTYRRLQHANRELVDALPDRDSLLSELGREMKGLRLHEVHPLMQHGQAQLIHIVRRDETHYLEPRREAIRQAPRLETRTPVTVTPQVERIAELFCAAPQHILQRLRSSEIEAALVATRAMRTSDGIAATRCESPDPPAKIGTRVTV